MSSTTHDPPHQHAQDLPQDFQPLSPMGQPGSLSQRLQHINIPSGSSASFGYIVAKQWHADIANRRNTWAVVGTPLEAKLLYKDVVTGAPADTPGINRSSLVISGHAGDHVGASRSGLLVVMPFSHLRELLSHGLFTDPPLLSWINKLGGPTIVMDFNWGNATFDMAFSCSLIATYIRASINHASNLIMACTVSDNKATYFGEIQQHMTIQRVMTPFDARVLTLRFHDNIPELITPPPPDTDGQPRERRGRWLLVIDDEDRQDLPEELRPRGLESTGLTSM